MLGNVPTEHARSPWAVGIVFVVVILFGLFWFFQQKEVRIENSHLLQTATVPEQKQNQPHETLYDISHLEASAVNIAIPSFEELF